MHDVAEFLRAHDPFRGLDEAALEQLASRAEVEYFPEGAAILAPGGGPRDEVRVVRRGAVALIAGDRVLDVLEEGEMFGHPPMLAGLPDEVEVRAHEDTLCYALAAEDVLPLLTAPGALRQEAGGGPAQPEPAAASARIAGPEMAKQPAARLLRERAVLCEPELTVREAAGRMGEEAVSSLLVRLGDGELGMVTDSDLRSRVLATGLPANTPVREVATAPVITVDAEQAGADVMLVMLDRDIHHVPVVAAGGEVLGVLSDIDLVAAEAGTPFVLRRAIADAHGTAELREVAGRLNSAVVSLHRADVAAAQVSEVISVVADALIRRMIELAIEAKGPPPAEFVWLSLGSHGRRDPMPSSDVDSGMAWQDHEGGPDAGPYMHGIADDVAATIEVLGWRLDPHGVTASGSFSGNSIGEWRSAIEGWLSRPVDERVLIATSILLDSRMIYGRDPELDPNAVLHQADDRFILQRWMLRLALSSRPPTGFRRNIVLEDSGEHRGTLDIKHGGLLPVVNLARYAGLRAGSRETSTRERLRAAAEKGVLDTDRARALAEAYDLFMSLRLEHQVRQLERGADPDDHLDPKDLNPLTRSYLRDAFREVSAVQKSLSGELTWGG